MVKRIQPKGRICKNSLQHKAATNYTVAVHQDFQRRPVKGEVVEKLC